MKRRALTGGERADWLRLSRTRGIGPITFFHLIDRYGSATAALEPRAKGANRLIKQGAALVESADDVLQAMQTIAPPTFEESSYDRHSAPEADVPPAFLRAVREALSPMPVRVDEIVRAADAPHHLVLATLAELELAGEAITHIGGMASRAV